MIQKGLISNLVGAICMLLFAACASAPKANISQNANIDEEISKLETDIQNGFDNQYDVLAASDFEDSRDALDEAKEDQKDGDEREEIIESLAKARGYYNRATATANNRTEPMKGLLDARQAALKAGAKTYPDHKEELEDLDDEFVDLADDLEDMTSEDFNYLQKEYVKLELATVQMAQLKDVRARIEAAVDNDAKSDTPRTLERARRDLVNAENTIAANLSNPAGYKKAVNRAKDSSQLLEAVLAASQRDGTTLPESTALEIVAKDKTLRSLNSRLATTRDQLENTSTMLSSTERRAESQQEMLNMNEAIMSVSNNFSDQEAEVYRQGNKVLLRLRGLNFKSGSSNIPENSEPLLQKVKEVASQLNASEIVVAGHTDSVGTEKVNKELSKARAEAVATYLTKENMDKGIVTAEGYGFEKPLTTNKTKEGRALNRRVDVIITPSMERAPASL